MASPLEGYFTTTEEVEKTLLSLIGSETDPSKLKTNLGLDYDDVLLSLFKDSEFVEAIDETFRLLTSDVDNDGKFTENDLKMTLDKTKEELVTMFSSVDILLNTKVSELIGYKLFENFVIIVNKMKDIKADKTTILDIFLKMIVYQMLIKLPTINSDLITNEQLKILMIKIIAKIYIGLVNSKMVESIIADIYTRFTKSSWYCCGSQEQPKSVLLIKNNKDISFGVSAHKLTAKSKSLERENKTLRSTITVMDYQLKNAQRGIHVEVMDSSDK